jgi:NADH:ubiquinone oxidoreductase subunit K
MTDGLTLAPGPIHWLALSAILFSIGLYGLLTRRNAIAVLMAVELMLNSAALNFVVLNRFVVPTRLDGHIMAIFVIAVAAAEVVVGMAIFVALFRYRHTVDVNRMDTLNDKAPVPPLEFPKFG